MSVIFYSCCPTLYLIQKIAVNGHNYTIITSRGGPGFTLAPSGVGVSTSVFGSVYRIATPTSSDSATSSAPATSSATSPHLIIVAIVIGLVIFIIGGWICVLKHKKKRRKQAKDAADAAAKAKAARPAPEKYPYSGYPDSEYYRDYRSRQY